jgi:hypothetical protein
MLLPKTQQKEKQIYSFLFNVRLGLAIIFFVCFDFFIHNKRMLTHVVVVEVNALKPKLKLKVFCE